MSNTNSKRVCLFVTIVRHGETELNRKVPRVLQGQSDHPMNSTGIQQSNALAWRLRKYQLDYIYCSDLSRANQMAVEIAKYHPEAPVVKDERLREMNLGELTGLSWPKVKSILKKEDKHFEDVVGRKGERPADFRNRVINFYGALLSRHLVQPHEKIMTAMFAHSLNLNTTEANAAAVYKSAIASAIPGQVCEPLTKSLLTRSHAAPVSKSDESASLQVENMPSIPKMKQRHILLVSHGGWIEQLFKYLLEDMKFTVEGKTDIGFPKNASMYQFRISKSHKPDGDYEWEGSVQLMNSVGHLACLEKNTSEPYNPEAPSATNTVKAVAGVISPSPSRRNIIVGPNSAGVPRGLVQPPRKKLIDFMKAPQNKSAERVRSLGW
ncbi:hypothetical protein BDV3_004220 [Batrachochytrium dendrobatidis]|nr:hypothetical protein O5D80_008127 [Batrachochytrium dendrobatidis]KAK5673086.1 hypothetical protein QVD99_000548 [Batrachochytrium dendrobatidis]